MAEIRKIPKQSRFNQQRPPLATEPVDEGLVHRLGLPRYVPAKRGGKRAGAAQPGARAEERPKRFTSQPLPDLPSELKPGAAGRSPRKPGDDAASSPVGARRSSFQTPLPARQPPGESLPGPELRTERPGASGARSFPRPAAGGSTPGSKSPARPADQRAALDRAGDARGAPPARPGAARRPFGSNPLGRGAGSRQESETPQPRSFRLPPLDFQLPESPETNEQEDARDERRPDGWDDILEEEAVETPAVHQDTPAASAAAPDVEIPSLREVLVQAGDIPAHTAVLGVCDDGLPILLNLFDPAPGSLLVISDERQQELNLLRLAVISVALRNSARGLQFLVVSHQPEVWSQWVQEQNLQRYSLGVVGVETAQAREWIYRLAEWREQRAGDERAGPPLLVLFDSLSFINRLAPDARARLDEVIADGPDVRIWSMAAVSTALASSLNRQLEAFATRIWGFSEDAGVYTRLAGVPAGEARSFGDRGQFAVRVGPQGEQAWLKFRLPAFDVF